MPKFQKGEISQNIPVTTVKKAFTLAELIVVIAILTVLATIGLLSLSWYRQDAKSAVVATNVRSVYSAIASEAASTTQSARCFIKHDANYALGWGAFVAFDGSNAENLVGGACGISGTNYSVGNPDYAKLRLDAEKFKTAFLNAPKSLAAMGNLLRTAVAETANPEYLLVGATDLTDDSGAKPRVRSFAQVAGIHESKASVTGDFPGEYVGGGSVSGLVKDTAYSESSTGALVDGAIVGAPAKCPATTASGYSFPELQSGSSHTASKEESGGNGNLNMTATCSFGTNAYSGESVVCNANYVPSGGNSCVLDTCSGTAFDTANAQWWAQINGSAGTASWSYSQTAWTCKFSCASGFTWDSSTGVCRASCASVISGTYQSLSYSFATGAVLSHGESVLKTGTHAFWTSPAHGTLSADFEISCANGTSQTVNVTAGTGICQTNYGWNSSWTTPSCAPSVRSANCSGSVPANATANTAATYSQTWDGNVLAWLPEISWTHGAATCGFACNSTYVWGGTSCLPMYVTTSGNANYSTTLPKDTSAYWRTVGTAKSSGYLRFEIQRGGDTYAYGGIYIDDRQAFFPREFGNIDKDPYFNGNLRYSGQWVETGVDTSNNGANGYANIWVNKGETIKLMGHRSTMTITGNLPGISPAYD